MRDKENKGFTLLELLVVISILGILAALLLANLANMRERARDARRQSDIKQYQAALGNYASDHSGLYPPNINTTSLCGTTLPGLLNLPTCIDDPQAAAGMHYGYRSNAGGTEYVIWSGLEGTTGTFWVLCSNGLVGQDTGAPANSTCPLP